MPEKPVMHGRDHRPGGTDPIPGLGLPWAYLSAGGTSTAIGASSTVQLTADNTTFYTNASSVFDVHLNGSSIYGIRLLGDGHYLFWISARPMVAPTAGDHYQLIVVGGGQFADFQFAPLGLVFPTGAAIDDGIVSTGGVMNVGGFISAPTNPITAEISNTSSHTLHFEMAGIVVMQLDTTSSDLN